MSTHLSNGTPPSPYAITGITGQVGGVVARTLLDHGQAVRAVVRSPQKAAPWAARGCETAVADMSDAAALTAAFTGCEGAFVLLPPYFDPSPGFPEASVIIAAVRTAVEAARPGRLVCLSTIGAPARQTNLLTPLGMLEHAMADLPLPVTFLRPAWFADNASWDVGPAMTDGAFDSYLQPLDRAIPMVATADVGRVAAELLRETWTGRRVVELEGPCRVSPNDIARTFFEVLGRPVRVRAVPRDTWTARFTAQGASNPEPRARMLDGFNEGWIRFDADERDTVKGHVPLATVLRELVARHGRP